MTTRVAMMIAGYMAGGRPSTVGQASSADSGLGGALGGLLGGSGAGQSGLGGLASMLDMNGDGNPLDDILRMASGKR